MKTKLMNMCMITNEKGEFLFQERIKSWKGAAFPGGKMEECEGVIEGIMREVKEETGLDIYDIKFCGFKTWINYEDKVTNIVFCFKTDKYSGELITESLEGRNFWISKDEIYSIELADNFQATLDLYLGDKTEILWKKENEEWTENIY